MNIFFSFFIFIFGLIIGSFLNCVIYRLSKKQSFLSKRSYCPYCGHTLHAIDLIPILSFIILKGRCRYCQKPISIQYPLVELSTGLLFSFIFLKNIESLFSIPVLFWVLDLFFLFIICCFLIVIFVYDVKYYIIPDRVIYPAVLTTAVWYLISRIFFSPFFKYNIFNILFSGIGASLFFLAIVFISRGKGMGMGDVKLAFFMGIFLGFPRIAVAIFLSFFIGAIIGIILIFLGKKKLKSEIPFAPFLITGTFLAFFYGDKLINLYFNLLL